MTYRKLAYSAVLVALGVGLGYVLARFPNVELVSFAAVLSGVILGTAWGVIDGAFIFLIFSMLSPFGMAPVPLLAAQALSGALLGLAGGLFGKKIKKPACALLLGIAGTLMYDILTNAAGYFTFPTGQTFIVYLIGGISFSVIHIFANGLLFCVLFPIILKQKLLRINNRIMF